MSPFEFALCDALCCKGTNKYIIINKRIFHGSKQNKIYGQSFHIKFAKFLSQEKYKLQWTLDDNQRKESPSSQTKISTVLQHINNLILDTKKT